MEQNQFTPEERELMSKIAEKWKKVSSKDRPLNKEVATEYVNFLYEKVGKIDKPKKILFAKSPVDAQRLMREEDGNQLKNFEYSSYGNVSDSSWLAYYDFQRQAGKIEADEIFETMCDLAWRSGVFDMMQYDTVACIVPFPLHLHRDENLRLHCTTGSTVEWEDGHAQYYVHGRDVPEWVFLGKLDENGVRKPLTRDDFFQEENEETRAAIYEVLGEEKFMELMGAEEVDSKSIAHENGQEEIVVLYETKDKVPTVGHKMAWVKMQCPSTGTNFFIEVDDGMKDAAVAAATTSPFWGEEIKTIEDYKFIART